MAAPVPDLGWYPDPSGSPNWRERGLTSVQINRESGDVPELSLFAGLGAYLVLRWLDSQVHRDDRRRDS